MSRWFRLYADAMRNPKVMRLADKDFRLWVRLLAVASENDGIIPPVNDLKLVLSMRLDHLLTGLKGLISGGLIDALDDGYQPHNWAKFQYKSDTSSERVAKHRAKCNVTETPPETEADTETERKKASANALTASAKPRRAVRCPDDWQPSALPADLATIVSHLPAGWLERQLTGMRDWSAASPNGAKTNWDAAWRNWVRRKLDEEPTDARPSTSNRPLGGSGRQERSGVQPARPITPKLAATLAYAERYRAAIAQSADRDASN
jgi:hypothetical protein